MEKMNNTSRRDFIINSLASLSILALPNILKSDKLFSQEISGFNLFFAQSDLPRIKKNIEHSVLKTYWESILNADLKADKKFLNEELNIRRHWPQIIRVGEILRRSALVSMLTNNKDHEDIAKLAIEKMYWYEDWDYFMEGGTDIIGFQCAPDASIAFVFALNCLNEKLSKAEIDDMLKALADKGAKPCYLSLYGMKYPDKVKGWSIDPREDYKNPVSLKNWPVILNKTNLKIVPTAALILNALALNEKDPDSKKWLEMGISSMESFSEMWGKDGCYSEGFSYSGYSTKHMIISIDSLMRAGKLRNINLINFKGYTRFMLHMAAPFKNNPTGCINFGDNYFSFDGPLMFWIAGKFKDSTAQYLADKFQSRHSPFSIIWFDGSIKPELPSKEKYDIRFSNDWVVLRDGWTEGNTVIGFRSGGPENHEHADRNSIILNAYGERLLHDPLGAGYQAIEKTWLLRQTESHTAILIDGKGHQYHDGRDGTNASLASAKILQFKTGEKLSYVTSDATQAYNLVIPDVQKVERTVAFIKPDVLVIIDKMKKKTEPSRLQARFQAYNVDGNAVLKVLHENEMFIIERPFAKLYAKVFSSSKVSIMEGKIDVPAEKGIFPFIEVSNEPSKNCIMITVCALVPIDRTESPDLEVGLDKKEYKIRIKSGLRKKRISIIIGKKVPVIKIIP